MSQSPVTTQTDEAPVLATMEKVAVYLKRWRFLTREEKVIQERIEVKLREGGFTFRREVPLGTAGIIDFLIEQPGEPVVGVEVKLREGLSDVTRQLHNYAGTSLVGGLLLVTTRMLHNDMPDTMCGRPVRVVVLPGGLTR